MGGAEKFVVEAVKLHHSYLKQDPGILFFNSGVCVDNLREYDLESLVLKTRFKLTKIFSLFRALIEIRALVRSGGYEIIHSTMAYGHLVMTAATLGLKLKRVWFQHGPVSGVLDKVASLLPVDVIIFNSQYLQKVHEECNYDLYSAQKVILPLGIAKVTPKLSLSKNSKIEILMVGRLSPFKGFHLVLEAFLYWAKTHQDWPKSFHLTIVGSANSEGERLYEGQLKELARELGEQVSFKPFTTEIQHFYDTSDILIQPSLMGEGFGLVLAEAMASGLLVLGPNYGGGVQILKDGITGIALDFNSQEAFSRMRIVLKSFSENPQDFAQMRNAAAKLISEQYSQEKMMNDLKAIYELL